MKLGLDASSTAALDTNPAGQTIRATGSPAASRPERLALARMNRPDVARVSHAGATKQGRPYFVMEDVSGTLITEYGDLKCIPLQERLGPFNEVCEAI